MKQLHFTFGPVQEFVSEARKTVDLWTGSYLISYLAAHAVKGALDAGAEAENVFPRIIGNPLMEAVRDPDIRPGKSEHPAARVGSLPNRFSANVVSEEQGVTFARAAEDGLMSAWMTATEACWSFLTERCATLKDKAEVWNRQTGALWEISWVVSDNPRTLSSRKLMRVFTTAAVEPGRKCTVCGKREELGNRRFWEPFPSKLGSGFLDPEKERLCAVCLVKRTLPKVGEEAFGYKIGGEAFPSTPDLAADTWQRKVLLESKLKEERSAFSASLGEPFEKSPGAYFFPSGQEEISKEKAGKLSSALPALIRAVGSAPRPTYAILAMDGDSMGVRLSKLDDAGRAELSERILEFSLRVREIVERGTGRSRLVYAGGEDVLALLPMDRGLRVAWEVRNLYHMVFRDFDETYRDELSGGSTISAGLLYCPMTLSLRAAIRESHRLLDEDAKSEAGRDALAIGVWKGGGETLKVARKWEAVEKLLRMNEDEETPYPSRFLYQAREISRNAENLPLETVTKLLALEYHGSREGRFETKDIGEAEQKIAPLLEISRADGGLDPAIFRLARFFYEEGA